MIPAETVWRRLAGTWSGRGAGSYPDIPAFEYTETLVLTPEPDWNMLSVLQRTWRRGNGEALHLESGIVLARDDGSLIYGCGQDSGRTEAMRGTVSAAGDGLRIDWITFGHANDDRLVKMGRTWWVSDGELRYEAHLSTVRTPEYRKHLEATLRRET